MKIRLKAEALKLLCAILFLESSSFAQGPAIPFETQFFTWIVSYLAGKAADPLWNAATGTPQIAAIETRLTNVEALLGSTYSSPFANVRAEINQGITRPRFEAMISNAIAELSKQIQNNTIEINDLKSRVEALEAKQDPPALEFSNFVKGYKPDTFYVVRIRNRTPWRITYEIWDSRKGWQKFEVAPRATIGHRRENEAIRVKFKGRPGYNPPTVERMPLVSCIAGRKPTQSDQDSAPTNYFELKPDGSVDLVARP